MTQHHRVTNLHFYDFGKKSDVRAERFYSRLLDAKYNGDGAIDSWLKVPTKVRLDDSIRRSTFAGEPDYLWTGFDWIKVFTYPKGEKLYARLPSHGELAE